MSPKPPSSPAVPCSSEASRSALRRASGTAARPRADRDTIVVGERSNVQDGCVLHADPGVPLSVGSQVTIGHNATLHGCTVEDLVLIGMGAIVLNGARVGRHSIIAAGTVLAEGQQVPEGVLVAGVPGKVRREVSEAGARSDPAQRRHVRRAIPAASPRRSVRCAVPGPGTAVTAEPARLPGSAVLRP